MTVTADAVSAVLVGKDKQEIGWLHSILYQQNQLVGLGKLTGNQTFGPMSPMPIGIEPQESVLRLSQMTLGSSMIVVWAFTGSHKNIKITAVVQCPPETYDLTSLPSLSAVSPRQYLLR